MSEAAVENFQASRLRDAVAASRIQPSALARAAGVPVAEVSGCFSGAALPGPELLEALARELGVKPAYFLSPSWDAGDGPVFERSLSPGTKQHRMRARQHLSRMAEIAHFLDCVSPLPAGELRTLPADANWQDVADRQVDELAEGLRRDWGAGDGPLPDLSARAEACGVLVGRFDMDEHSLHGCSRWDETLGRPCVFVGDDQGDWCQWRFVLATEIGHMALHRGATVQELSDRSTFGLAGRQARRFAKALLAPAATFGPESPVGPLERYPELKNRWQAPISVMIEWSRDLGWMTDRQARDANIAYHRQGWSRGEPAATGVLNEAPALLAEAVRAGVSAGRFTPGDVAGALPFLPAEVERLTGLPAGYLGGAELQEEA